MASYGSIQTATLDPGETAIVITKPTSLAAGDLMVAVLAVTGTGSYTASGWSELAARTITDFNYRMTILVKVADSGDAAATNFTFDVPASGDSKVGALLRVTGTAFSGLSNCTADTDRVASDNTPTYAGGVTPLASTSLLIMGCFSGGVGTSSDYAIANNNPSWTERADINVNDAEDISLSVATADYAFASSTGDYSLSITDGTETGGYIIAISDTANVSVTLTPLILNGTVNDVTPSAGVSVTLNPLTLNSTLPSVTVDSEDNPWTNQDESADDTWIDQPKS